MFCCDLQTAASCFVSSVSDSNFSRSVCSRELPSGSDLLSVLVEEQTEWQRQGRKHQISVLCGVSACVLVGLCAAGLCWGNIRRLQMLTRGDQTPIPDSPTWFMPSLWKENNTLLYLGEKLIHQGCELNSYWGQCWTLWPFVGALLAWHPLHQLCLGQSFIEAFLHMTEWESQINISLFWADLLGSSQLIVSC